MSTMIVITTSSENDDNEMRKMIDTMMKMNGDER